MAGPVSFRVQTPYHVIYHISYHIHVCQIYHKNCVSVFLTLSVYGI